ncbi:MAG: endospore germination permease [Bacillus sp. (in: Bacteria)]|nr:endospore germination permease [Bacillus sp. (in: firmicutes)]
MRKEQITDKEATYLLILFYVGGSFILGVGAGAKNDAWISSILGMVLAIPIILVYARICKLYPEKGLYDILELVFGKVIGKIFIIIYIWYSFHLGALVIRNFGAFINTVAMTETPLFVPLLCLGIVGIVAVSAGIEVMGRISTILLPILLIIIVVVELLAIPQFTINFIKPILGNGLFPVFKGGFSVFSFPFAESVVFIAVLFSLKPKMSPFKVYLKGTAIAGLLIVVLISRNILILGELNSKLYFPSHVAVSRISVGDFLQRIELTVAFNFICGAFLKSSVCLWVACQGVAKLFNINNYRSIVIQMGLLMVYFSYAVYDSTIEMRNWAMQIYPFYAFPFQVIFPLIILITAEIKIKMKGVSKSM